MNNNSNQTRSNEDITKRLDALIAFHIQELQLKDTFSSGKLYTDLRNLGFSQSEIGNIVGRPGKDIGATITMYKKQKSKKGKVKKDDRNK